MEFEQGSVEFLNICPVVNNSETKKRQSEITLVSAASN